MFLLLINTIVVIIQVLISCGKKGIRTPDTLLTYTRFPGVPLQPLEHLSPIAATRALRSETDANRRTKSYFTPNSSANVLFFFFVTIKNTIILQKKLLFNPFITISEHEGRFSLKIIAGIVRRIHHKSIPL